MSGDSRWGTTNRVYYCEIHDSLVRKADVTGLWEPSGPRDDIQCDWAVASKIPFVVEACTVEIPALEARGVTVFHTCP